MKKVLFAALMLFAALAGNADERSKQVLDRMAVSVKGMKSYQVDFLASVDGEFKDIRGKFIVSGDRFFISVYDSEVFCDGKARYTYSKENNEVVVEEVDNDDNSILSNPTRIFNLLDKDFTHKYKGDATVGGKSVSQIELMPRGSGMGFSNLVLSADKSNGMPVLLTYRLTDIAKTMTINVQRITPDITVSPATFTFDSKKYPGVEVIDFR